MDILYRNKHNNETKTYEEWYLWAYSFYNTIDPCGEFITMPVDWWSRLVKVFKLEKI